MDTEASVHGTVEALSKRQRLSERLFADRYVIRPTALGDARKIHIVNAAACRHSQTERALGRQCLIHMDIGVVDEGRTKLHGFKRTEPGQRNRLFWAHHMALRHTGRIGRCKAHILGNATHHGEDRVRMHVDEPGCCHQAASVDQALGSGRGPLGRADKCQRVARDCNPAFCNLGLVRIGCEDMRTLNDEIGKRFGVRGFGHGVSLKGAIV